MRKILFLAFKDCNYLLRKITLNHLIHIVLRNIIQNFVLSASQNINKVRWRVNITIKTEGYFHELSLGIVKDVVKRICDICALNGYSLHWRYFTWRHNHFLTVIRSVRFMSILFHNNSTSRPLCITLPSPFNIIFEPLYHSLFVMKIENPFLTLEIWTYFSGK